MFQLHQVYFSGSIKAFQSAHRGTFRLHIVQLEIPHQNQHRLMWNLQRIEMAIGIILFVGVCVISAKIVE